MPPPPAPLSARSDLATVTAAPPRDQRRPRLTPVPSPAQRDGLATTDPVELIAHDLATAFPGERPLLIEVEHGVQQTSLTFALAGDGPDDVFAVERIVRARRAALLLVSRAEDGLRVKLLLLRPGARLPSPAAPPTWRDHLKVLVHAAPAKK